MCLSITFFYSNIFILYPIGLHYLSFLHQACEICFELCVLATHVLQIKFTDAVFQELAANIIMYCCGFKFYSERLGIYIFLEMHMNTFMFIMWAWLMNMT